MKLIDISDYNRAAKTYWIIVVCAGAAVFVWALRSVLTLSTVQWVEFAGLLALVIFAGSNPIRIPNTESSFTAGDAFTFAELKEMFENAGFSRNEHVPLEPTPQHLIVSMK